MKFELKYTRYSENSILIEWPSQINEEMLYDILSFKRILENKNNKVVLEVVNAYNSLLISYGYTINNFYDEVFKLKSWYVNGLSIINNTNRLWQIPVCYTASFASDLTEFSKLKSLTVDEIISLHTSVEYTVYFIGFLPGFMYLGGLHKKLYLPRKLTPSRTVKKGSVAIGGNQTGVYPSDSPGGWYVIGRTPINFFDVTLEEPCVFKPGDTLRFVSINEKEYNDISSQVLLGEYQLHSL